MAASPTRPAPGFTGTDTYTYRVCLAAPNGSVCSTAMVTVSVDAATVAPIPTLGEWALLLLMAGMAGLGMARLHRRS